MQLDKPAKRRPRPNRPRSQPQTSEEPNSQYSNQRHTFQPKPKDPFEPLIPQPAPSNAPFAAFRNSATQNTFGNSGPFPSFGQSSPSANASRFGRSPSRGMKVEHCTNPSFTSPFGQPDPFAPKPPPVTLFAQPSAFGQNVTFGPNVTFGQNVTSSQNVFGQRPKPFQHPRKNSEREAISSTPEPKPRTRRRTRPLSKPDNNKSTPTREREQQDLDLDDIQPSSEPERRKSPKQNQVLVKSVPLQLFSRAALQRHFSSIPGVHVTHVSLRGTRRPDSRRTALITFPTEQNATTALRKGQSFKGIHLQLSLFRQNPSSERQVAETNELFFNYVPEPLFSETSIKHLFDTISENCVTNVSLKERPHYGSVKRTAIITFTNSNAAAMALRNLPLYKGRTLTVAFRRTRPQPSNATSAPVEKYVDTDDFMKPFERNEESFEEYDTEQNLPNDVQSDYAGPATTYGTISNDDDIDPVDEDMPQEDEQTTHRTIDREAEIDMLKAAILKMEKQRAQMSKPDKDKRERKVISLKPHESSKTEQDSQNSGWRKVGEKVDINNAANFVGTCMTMCPYKEFEDRILQRDVSLFEMDDHGEPAFAKAIKKYRRSAAISEQPSPEEVRPPRVLLDTMEHLKKICDSTDTKFADVHNFVRDRTRSLRQDFTLQGVRDESCIKIHEESVRFHILSEHRLYGTDPAVFSSKQNLEQLDKCLISLREMYDLRRDNDLGTSPNESEMQAYYILTQMSDPKTCVQLCTGFAQDVRCSREVQFALQVVRAASEGFGSFTRYFSLVRSAPYLMACLMHSRFSVVRTRALAVINVTHGNPNSADNIPISAITRQLGFEDDEEAENFCDTLGMRIESTVLPSMPSKVISIRTPSENFEETKVSEWESSRADNLIESKAHGVKTSEIIYGSGRNDFNLASSAKKTSKPMETKKNKAPVNEVVQFPMKGMPQPAEDPLDANPTPPTDPLTLIKSLPAPKISTTLKTEVSIPPKHDIAPGITFDQKPQADQRKGDDFSHAPRTLSMGSTVLKSPKQRRKIRGTVALGASSPFTFFDATPLLNSSKPISNAASTTMPFLSPVKPVAPKGSHANASSANGLAESGRSVPVSRHENLEVRVPTKPQRGALEASCKELLSSKEPDTKSPPPDLKKAARYAALKALLSDLIRANQTDFKKVRRIIRDAQTGTLRFPKAMEIWDDAKDVLLGVSERTERGLQELEAEDSPGIDAFHEDFPRGEDFREKLRFCSHEGTELWDQLNEAFSKSLALATASLRESGFRPSAFPRGAQVPQMTDQLDGFSAYSVDDEDAPFGVCEVPDRGAEVQSILSAMNKVGLIRWQAVIADIACLQNNENEVGIAQRWLRQRLSTDIEQQSGSLCLVDSAENGSHSLSIREAKEISNIPYTTNLLVLSCDIRTLENNPPSTWTSLEQVLRKNRSFTRSYGLPPPKVVVLYYRGSSDMPLWFTDEDTTRSSFTTFQTGLQEKGYASTCEKLELSRTSAFESVKCELFTDSMSASVRECAQGLKRLGNVTRKTNLRDYLVHVANNAIGEILDSTSLEGDTGDALRAIHQVNESWKGVVRRLRREEACWPKEMQERRRLVDAYTSIETKLQLPVPEEDCLITDYISDLAVATGFGVPAHQQLDGLFSFCCALGHIMNAFVRQRLFDCAVLVVYLPVDYLDKTIMRKARPRVAYHINPSKVEKRDDPVTSRYIPRTEPQRKTKRLREENSLTDWDGQALYPHRRLNLASINPIPEERLSSEFASKRRRSLPASYGRRRMFELLDGIYNEEQAFDDLIQATMNALIAKRRRLQERSAVLVT